MRFSKRFVDVQKKTRFMTQSNKMAQNVAFSHNVNFTGEVFHNLW